ncbi:MAG: hypothetical protein AAFP90_01855 [Planctomycetota bacterium]
MMLRILPAIALTFVLLCTGCVQSAYQKRNQQLPTPTPLPSTGHQDSPSPMASAPAGGNPATIAPAAHTAPMSPPAGTLQQTGHFMPAANVQQVGFGRPLRSDCNACQTPAMACGPNLSACGPPDLTACLAPNLSAAMTGNWGGMDPSEYLCDGGDRDPRAVAVKGKQEPIAGVEMQDTVARYTDPLGRIDVTASNRVCVYAPRFAAVRHVSGAEIGQKNVMAGGIQMNEALISADLAQPGLVVADVDGPNLKSRAAGPDAVRGRDLGVPITGADALLLAKDYLAALENRINLLPGQFDDLDRITITTGVLNAITWSHENSVEVEVKDLRTQISRSTLRAEEVSVVHLPGGRLHLTKMADRGAAKSGDLVTFMLRMDNVGEGDLEDVVVTDNLVPRLAYVENSQQASVQTLQFSTTPNSGMSTRLSWKLTEPLKRGESVTITFQARVR